MLTATPPDMHSLSSYDYELPPELIAQHPSPERTSSRLLDGSATTPVDRQFLDLPSLLQAGDVLVMNNTQVLRARLFGQKASGGRIEALVERVLPAENGQPPQEVWAHIRASKSPRTGSCIRLGLPDERETSQRPTTGFEAEVLGRCGPDQGLFHLRVSPDQGDVFSLLERYGRLPLPPYIDRANETADVQRYQTVVAQVPGAVAAPTAALHFDQAMLNQLQHMGVKLVTLTLHVGAGTFQPVRNDDIRLHRMHSEWLDLPQSTVDAIHLAHQHNKRVVAVGTTSVRALESMVDAQGHLHAGQRETDIFITPGHTFHVVDALLTNFHLPKSTLLMLVSAFAGYPRMRQLYEHAVSQHYRFFSYGDAMWLTRKPDELENLKATN